MLALDLALERLAALDDRQAKIVELRFFGGLSVEETADRPGAFADDHQARVGDRSPLVVPGNPDGKLELRS